MGTQKDPLDLHYPPPKKNSPFVLILTDSFAEAENGRLHEMEKHKSERNKREVLSKPNPLESPALEKVWYIQFTSLFGCKEFGHGHL